MPTEYPSPAVSEVRVRKVPKYGVFLAIGGVLGIIAAAILTYAFDGVLQPSSIGTSYSRDQVFGFLLLFLVAFGVALGAIVALILDRVMRRKTTTAIAEHETIHVQNPAGF